MSSSVPASTQAKIDAAAANPYKFPTEKWEDVDCAAVFNLAQ